jgi:hypothetical protein
MLVITLNVKGICVEEHKAFLQGCFVKMLQYLPARNKGADTPAK